MDTIITITIITGIITIINIKKDAFESVFFMFFTK